MAKKKDAIQMIEHEIAMLMRRAQSRHAADPVSHSLDRSAYLLLGALDDQGPTTIRALADTFQLDISTASRQVASLEAKCLIERVEDPSDGRASLVHITAEGTRQLHSVQASRYAMYADILNDWSSDELDAFCKGLSRLTQSLREWIAQNRKS